jgi:hypothetical protein
MKGYSFTVESINDWLKAADAFVGPYNNYIDVANLHKYFPNVFNGFQQIDPWDDVPPDTDLISDNLVVLCRVNAKGIGGSGSHYLLLVGVENGVAIINDPWTGKTEPITQTYGNLGNILSIVIFNVIPYQQNAPTNTDKDQKIIDLTKENDQLKQTISNNNQISDQKVSDAVKQAITTRDSQWQDIVKSKLDERQKSFDEILANSNKDWQIKLNSASGIDQYDGWTLVSIGMKKVFG